MSERKVLNKYFPPDFDPAKIPRRKMPKDEQHKVRLMTPFSMQCDTCGDYIYKGKKFNARKELVAGETYLGIKIFRFYIRCPRCSSEITFKTDPKHSDYVAEHGAQRNFEPWREEGNVDEELKAERTQEEKNNPMKALENRTIDSKREMDILDALDEIRTKNAHTERLDANEVLAKILDAKKAREEADMRRQEEEDEAAAKAIFQSSDGNLVKRISLSDEDEEEDLLKLVERNHAEDTAASIFDLVSESKPEAPVVLSTSSSSSSVLKPPPRKGLDGLVRKRTNADSAVSAPPTKVAKITPIVAPKSSIPKTSSAQAPQQAPIPSS
ncbi:hypothetical protein HDU76_006152, partial [Blyttiomyces sp. JEL0837]